MTPPTVIFERDNRVFLVGAVAPFTPGASELEEIAAAEDLRKIAPNENIMWLRGSYVEADKPNQNGAEWSSDELSIASLTPRLMPVTVMHDPSTAVGMIADTKLLTPNADGVPRARIDNTLGLWAHRFPEAAHEAMTNYKAGSLMQSMECLPAYYDCTACGTRYPNLAGKERANWCACLKGETADAASRRLGNVTFTGTGLIYGSRGAKGAYDDAHLEVLQDEVAEFHARALHDAPYRPTSRRKNSMEIDDQRYQDLIAKEAKLKELEPKLAEAQEGAAKVPDLESSVETLETKVKTAETDRDTEKAKREGLEEQARVAALATERMGKLGKPFIAKLGDRTKAKLDEQAGTLTDEDWTGRLEELAELTGVKPDEEGAAADDDEPTFRREEIARAGAAGGRGQSDAPSAAARTSVMGGLLKTLKPPVPAGKAD